MALPKEGSAGPVFEEEEDDIFAEKDEDSEDLFTPTVETPPKTEVKDDDSEKEDLFADVNSEVPLDSPEEKKDEPKSEPAVVASVGVTESITTTAGFTKPQSAAPVTDNKTVSEENDEVAKLTLTNSDGDEDEVDQFPIEIAITEPKKVGDGMGAYMAYKVNTKTAMPSFKKPEVGVYRRFSDFLGLHEKLVEKHQLMGRIIPPPPEKSVLGMTKIKVSKEEAGSQEFVEKRRAALERFLNRTAQHPQLRNDSDFKDFLEKEGDLPKSTSTSALSGAGVMRLFSRVGDSLGKMTFRMDETDQWFEEKQQQVEALDVQLRKLHSSIEALVTYRKELALNTGSFAKSAAMLGNAEEHTALSRALSQLAEVEEKIDGLHLDQADSDFFVFSELIKDYISMIGSVKDVFHERVKIFKNWKEAEQNLAKKREAKAKLELARKMDKVPAATAEITEWEQKVDKGQEDFEVISKNIRKEMARFEKQRVRDFRNTIIHYLESLMNNQQQLIKHWEGVLPEMKAIA